MNTIGDKTVERITADIKGMLETYLKDINIVYDDEAGVTINMSAKLEDAGDREVKITTKLSFTTGKISESYESSVNEYQEDLPFPEK